MVSLQRVNPNVVKYPYFVAMGKQKTHANRQVKTNNPPASPETQTDAQPVAKAVKQVNNPSHAPVLGRGSARLQKIHRALPTLS